MMGAKGTQMANERKWYIHRGDLEGVSMARRQFTAHLGALGADGDKRYDAALIFGELVANSVRCARTSTTVEFSKSGRPTLRVIDDGECFDPARIEAQPLYQQSGRGLYIAKTLACDLTVEASDARCEVTAVLPISLEE
jgi:anti-sigma regulatory factor (Ser/Thr protein kinase)